MKIIASLVLYKHTYSDIEKTLNSLLSEKSVDKICIVDNGSHCEWLNNFAHPKVNIIKLPVNKGFGSGHNATFKHFWKSSDFFLICNPDISFSPGQVDHLYEFSIQQKSGLAIPKVVYPDGSLQHGCKLLPEPHQLFLRRFWPALAERMNIKYELREADYDRVFFAPSLSGCFMLVSQFALESVKNFDDRFFLYLEDVDFSRRVCTSGYPVLYCPYSTVVHESQRRSYKDVKFLFYHISSAIRYFNKWGWFKDKERDELNSRCLSSLHRNK